ELRHIRASLPAAIASAEDGRALVVPASNGDEAALCRQAEVYGATSLLAVCAHLHARECLPRHNFRPPADQWERYPDLADVKGQAQARRALEVAAAGEHNILFYGPPGTGKTMLASRLPGILPPLDEAEALEAAAVASVASGRVANNWLQRPFRAPHHSASAAAMVGGGSNP